MSKTPISQLNQYEFVKIQLKPGDVWQVGRSFFRNSGPRTVTLESIRDIGDILKRRSDLMMTEVCVEMAKKKA